MGVGWRGHKVLAEQVAGDSCTFHRLGFKLSFLGLERQGSNLTEYSKKFKKRPDMLAFIGIGFPELLLIVFLYLIPILPLWKIFEKSGQNPWLSLLVLIPGLGVLIALFIAAYSNWRVQK